MSNQQVSNPNDFKVVEFHNKADFTFTPEMGCMFDGRPIFGLTGAPGVNAGESLTVPFHIGHRLATNLAKVVLNRSAPSVDPAGIPTGVPLWDTVKLENLKNSYLTDLYSETKPIAMTETDRLMAKVEEYKKMVEKLLENGAPAQPTAPAVTVPTSSTDSSENNPPANDGNVIPDASNTPPTNDTQFQDKQDVIAELEKRGIKHDKRKNKADLEMLLKNQ